jgi:hypothetical protein
MKYRKLIALLLLAFIVSACGSGPEVSPDSPEVQSGPQILFEDDFSDTGSGWDRTDSDIGSTDYDQGSYRIYIQAENSYVWANPSRNFRDVSVSVDATKAGGDDDNEFGLICRHANIENFYVATISSDGFYGFWSRKDGGTLELLNMENMLPVESIVQGNSLNTIRLECVGSRLTLYVNDEFVGETVDDSIESGDVGLYAGTFSIPGTEILFDNFVVAAP